MSTGELTWPETGPVIPAHYDSGIEVGLGADVSGWPVGADVPALVGVDRSGAAAEHVTVVAVDVCAKPAALDHGAAAALPLAGRTA